MQREWLNASQIQKRHLGGRYSSSAPIYADDVSDLKAQIQLLNERIAHLEAAKVAPAAAPAVPPTTATTPATPANGNKSDLAGVAQNDAAAAKTDPVTITQAPGGNLINEGETNISLYGKVDVTLASIDNEDAAGDRRTGSVASWMSGNRWGIHSSCLIDAVDQVRLTGGDKLGSAHGHDSQTEEGVGLRWSF